MSLNVLLSSLYCPNSNLLEHDVEIERVVFFLFPALTKPSHLSPHNNWTCWKSKLQTFLIAGLSRSTWQFLPAHVKQLVQCYLCFTDKQKLVTLLYLHFPHLFHWSLCSTAECTPTCQFSAFSHKEHSRMQGPRAGGAGQGFSSKKQHKQG